MRIGIRIEGVVAVAMATAAVSGCLLAIGTTATAAAPTCENASTRAQQEVTYLGRCRAYELVTPPAATPYLSNEYVVSTQAAANGESLSWLTYYPSPASYGGFYYMSTRTASGWESQALTGRQTTSQFPAKLKGGIGCNPSVLLSQGMERGVIVTGEASDGLSGEGVSGPGGEAEYCGANAPELVPGEPKGTQNIFTWLPGESAYRLVDLTPPGETPHDATFEAATEDFTHILFAEDAQLTETPAPGNSLYEWSSGAVRLVSVLPNGSSVEGKLADYRAVNEEGSAAEHAHAVADGGEVVAFTAEENAGERNLFLRLHANAAPHHGYLDPAECVHSTEACTIQLDTSTAGGPGGGGRFIAATSNGSTVYFADSATAKLTANTAALSGYNLYEYDVAANELKDLTPSPYAGVLGFSAIGEDGAYPYLYFAAEGKLASGAREKQPNLYVLHEDHVTFIATVEQPTRLGAAASWQPMEEQGSTLATEASPNGHFFAFNSAKELTGYNNVDVNTGQEDREVFLYNSGTNTLACVSCGSSGKPPTGSARLAPVEHVLWGAGPGRWRPMVFNSGAVLFESSDALVMGEVVGVTEVYEYSEGVVSLISSGHSVGGSYFDEADASGKNVFFVTAQKLVGADTNNGLSIYDARENGGFPEPAQATPCEEGGTCRPYHAGALAGAPTSNAFNGSGNLAQPPPVKSATSGKRSTRNTKVARMRERRLRRALKRCRRRFAHRRHRRVVCVRRARHRYGRSGGRSQGARNHHRPKGHGHASKGGRR